jgi:hypothetical protein
MSVIERIYDGQVLACIARDLDILLLGTNTAVFQPCFEQCSCQYCAQQRDRAVSALAHLLEVLRFLRKMGLRRQEEEYRRCCRIEQCRLQQNDKLKRRR